MHEGPLPEWCDRTCIVCPGQVLGPGRFDVVDRPGPVYAYSPAVGWRVDTDGVAVCVHPFRVGLPPGRYASAGVPVPAAATPRPVPSAETLELPVDVVDLEGWLVATLRTAPPDRLFSVVADAEGRAVQRFASEAVTKALRRVLSVELADR